jgi:hypothetical protein
LDVADETVGGHPKIVQQAGEVPYLGCSEAALDRADRIRLAFGVVADSVHKRQQAAGLAESRLRGIGRRGPDVVGVH